MMRNRSGFVLVMTLVLIALSGLVLASIARQSLRRAVQAQQAEQDLQRRWGSLSARRALLGTADKLFADQAEQIADGEIDAEFSGRITLQIELGQLHFDLLLADEDAKVNVNSLVASATATQARHIVRELSDAQPGLVVAFRPSRRDPPGSAVFESWEQVFRPRPPLSAPDVADSLRRATTRLTCWGSGQLNVKRASIPALQSIAGLVVGQRGAHQLAEWKREYPQAEAAELLHLLELRDNQSRRLGELLCDESTCYSLWISVGSSRRKWYEFHAISNSDNATLPELELDAESEPASDSRVFSRGPRANSEEWSPVADFFW